MSETRALVLADSAAGLRASGRLARAGLAVRHLGVGTLPVQPLWPSGLYGMPAALERWVGPTVPLARPRIGVLYRGSIRPMPRRRRDLATLAGGQWLQLAGDLRPHLRPPRTLGQWGPRQMGRRGWKRVLNGVFSKRLGLSCQGEPASLAGLLVAPEGAQWRGLIQSAHEASITHVEAVLDSGGEALERVEIEALEVEDGRVRAVMTEFGREHVDGMLYTDLAPSRLATLFSPGVLPASVRAALVTLPVQERSVVTLQVRGAEALPWVVWVADTHVPVVRVVRSYGGPQTPMADRIEVELETGPVSTRAVELARQAMSAHVEVVADVAVQRCVIPVPTLRLDAQRALAHLRGLGVVLVGALANHLPLSLAQEAHLAATWGHAEAEREALERLTSIPSHYGGVLP